MRLIAPRKLLGVCVGHTDAGLSRSPTDLALRSKVNIVSRSQLVSLDDQPILADPIRDAKLLFFDRTHPNY